MNAQVGSFRGCARLVCYPDLQSSCSVQMLVAPSFVSCTRHTHTDAPRCPQDPICTPDGYIYSKEAIVENLAAQKKNIKRRLAMFELQQEELQRKVLQLLPGPLVV